MGTYRSSSAAQVTALSNTKMGVARTAPITNRRVISLSSGLVPSASGMPSGSSAIPQIGQLRLAAVNLRMHRTGVDRALSDGRVRSTRRAGRGSRDPLQILTRICHEFGFAAAATKIVGLAIVLRVVLGGSWMHHHAADRIMGWPAAPAGVASGLLADGSQQRAF